jgi:hypothetical protein
LVDPSLPTRHLSPQTAPFARDHIALDLATQTLDSFANWAQRELRTPSPQSPPPLPPHHSKKRALKVMEVPVPFKGFKAADTDTSTSGTDSDPSTSDPFNIPSPPIVRATKAGGFIKNFYVLIDTLPPKRTTALSYPPVTLTPQVPQQGHLDDPDDQNDVLMDIITSPSRSPVLVRRLDPPVESVHGNYC